MAAANESQGLKIAVAAFIALTVILTVTCYFLYSAYASADAKMTAAQEEASKQQKNASLALTQYEEVRGKVGTKTTDYEPAKEEIGAHFKKIDQRLDGMINAVNTAVGKAQAEGAQGTELEETKQRIAQIAASMRSEPNVPPVVPGHVEVPPRSWRSARDVPAPRRAGSLHPAVARCHDV